MSQSVLIEIAGQDKFSGVSAQAADAVHKLGSAVSSFPAAANAGNSAAGSLASSIGNMATVAGGIVAAQVFNRIAEGIGSFVSTGLSAVGSAQMLESSLRSLLTANNMYEQSVETVSVAVTEQIMSQDEMAIKAAELNAKLVTQRATFQEQAEKIRQLTEQYGENGLVVIKTKAQHDQLALAMQDTERSIAGLKTSTTTYGTETKQTWKEVMSMADAQLLARKETEQLMDAISKMAVVSPFETQSVELVAKYAVAAGMGVDATSRFTAGFLDMAASVGIGSENLGFAADQLLQVKKVGKLTEIDLRQLRRMGIDVSKVLGVEMGMSVDEFNKKAGATPEIFDELFDAMTRFSENTFAGTSKEMANSVKGIQSTMSDIFVIGSRSFWRPIVESVSPMMSEFVGKISDFVLGGSMDKLGEQAAEMLGKGISGGINIFKLLTTGDFSGGIFGLAEDSGFIDFLFDIRETALSLSKIFRLLATGDFSGGIFGLAEDSWFIDFLFDTRETALSLYETFRLLATGDFRGGIFGLAEDSPVIDFFLTLRETIVNTFNQITDAIESGTIGSMLQNWAGQVLSSIPGALTGIIQGIATFLADNWPTISAALMEWSGKVWDWVGVAAAGAAGALIALGAAIMAWATSGEAQTAMKEFGQNLGTMITDYMKLQFEGGEGSTNTLLALATGLSVAVASITGSLIILGGQLVAGILDGILTSMGIDLEPATFNELRGILGGISSNIGIIASYVGTSIVTGIQRGWDNTVENISNAVTEGVEGWQNIVFETDWAELGQSIIDGILKGINDNVAKVYEVIKSMAGNAIAEAMSALGIASPSKPFAEMGRQIIAGLVGSVEGGIPDFQGALNQLLDLRTVGTSFMDVFGRARDDVEKSMDEWLNPDKVKFALRAMSKMIKDNLDFASTATDAQLEDMLMNAVGSWAQAGIGDPERMVGDFVNIFRDTQEAMKLEAQAAVAENYQKMLGGVSQFASAATQEADALSQKIAVLDTLLRKGGESFNVEGQIMNAAQAQERLNQLVAEQTGMQGDLASITGFQAGLQNMQEQQALLAGLSAPVDVAAGDVVGGLNQLMGLLGQQIMASLGQQIGIPGGAGVSSGTGGGMVGGTQNNITFSPTINTTANEQSIIQLFYQMMAMVPGGT